MDVDNIPPGIDFVSHLNNQVAACEVFVAVIGPNWLDAKNEDGGRRLHASEDFVAVEIAAALTRDIRVIPVLLDGTRMPKAGDLPEVLKPLVRRQAVELRHDQFGRDAETLIERIREAFPAKRATILPWYATAAIVALLFLGALLVLPSSPLHWKELLPHERAQNAKPADAGAVKSSDQTAKAAVADTQAAVQPPRKADSAVKIVEDVLSASQWEDETEKALGFRFSTLLLAHERRNYQIKDGVDGLVLTAVAPHSQAAAEHLSVGEVIVAASGEPVLGSMDLRRVFVQAKKEGKKTVILSVYGKDGETRFASMNLP